MSTLSAQQIDTIEFRSFIAYLCSGAYFYMAREDGEVVVVMCRYGQDFKVVLYLNDFNVVAMLSMSVRV